MESIKEIKREVLICESEHMDYLLYKAEKNINKKKK